MRIVEPSKTPASVAKSKKRKKKSKIPLLVVLVVLGVALYALLKPSKLEDSQPGLNNVSIDQQEPNQSADEIPSTLLREFSGNEFRLLFDNILLPNVKKVNTPPPITGNDVADTRIRQIAESRGYKLRSAPVEGLVYVDGYPVQKILVQDWRALKAEITSAGLSMSIVSAYRSVQDQKTLFVSRLQAEGVAVSDVAKGLADNEINTVLITTAVPGYSKHHTGYTLDFACSGFAFENFKNSTCHDWLSANNYEKAKKHGFIPSYPEDADLQGPDPEAWEYVYVGKELLYN